MKAINLQLEDLGPWVKLSTPPMSPGRKILPVSIAPNLHKRATTSVFQRKNSNDSDFFPSTEQDILAKYIKDNRKFNFPIIESANKTSVKDEIHKRMTQNFYNEVKHGKIFENSVNTEADFEGQHINHQYFPYRFAGLSSRIKSLDRSKQKNVFTYRLKKSVIHSAISAPKNYIFWNQRKLISTRNQKKPGKF